MSSLSTLFATMATTTFSASVKTVAGVVALLPENWKTGDFELEFTTAVSKRVSEWWNSYIRLAIRGGFLDYAEAGWLTMLARNVYKVDRITADFAEGGWTGTNASAGVLGPYAAGDLVFVHTTSGKTYRNAESVSFAVGVNAPVDVVADEVGTDSDAAPGDIELQTVVVGLTGTNAAAVLGRDEEEDEPLRARCRLKPASISPNGPRAAYEYVALTPTDTDGGRWDHGVVVNRVWISPWSEDATVEEIIAGPNGAIDPGDVDLVDEATQLNVVPDGVTATVASATNVTVPVTYTVYVRAKSGIEAATTEAACDLAIPRHFRAVPISGDKLPPDDGEADPGFVFVNLLESVIAQAARDLGEGENVQEVVQVVVSLPAADVELAFGEVPVAGTITGTVVQL